MTRIFKLIKSEIYFLYRTIILMGAILVLFVAALLSVISVLLDVPDGMYEGLNEYVDFFIMTSNAPNNEVPTGTSMYGHIDGITRYSVLTGTVGVKLNPTGDEESDVTDSSLTIGCLAIRQSQAEMLLSPYKSMLYGKSRFPTEPGEIFINTSVAKMAGAKLGDTVTLSPDPEYADKYNLDGVGPMTFTIVGTGDTSKIWSTNAGDPDKYMFASAHMFFVTDEETPYDSTIFSFPDSETLHKAYKHIVKTEYEVTLANALPVANLFKSQFEGLSLIQAFFGAISAVLALMVVFILYSLFAIFFRQRKEHICRLKLLGARSRTIAFVYCSVTIALILIAIIFGSLLASAFNVYFMALCGRTFDRFSANFVSHFRPVVQLSVFSALALIALLLFFNFNRKIDNGAIISEVRNDR